MSLPALERNYPDKSCHCKEPQATKQSQPGVAVAPRLLRFARNDSLCGTDGFVARGSATPVGN
jgi:hypothetical protein